MIEPSIRTHDITACGFEFSVAALERLGRPDCDLVLFIHGLGCVKESFGAAFETESLNEYSLLAPDLPGHGDTPAVEGFSYGMAETAAVLRALLDEFAFARLHVVAHSMGGAVGLLLVQNAQLALASFVNLEGNLVAEDCGLLSRRAAETPEDTFVRERFANLLQRVSEAEEPGTRLWARWAARMDAAAFYRASASLVEWSDSGELLEIFDSLDVPKAYLHGARSANPAVIRRLGRIPKHEIARAGHFALTDNAKAFYDMAARIIASA